MNDFLSAFFDIKEPELSENGRSYLIHSYLYYELNASVITDAEFDLLCKKLLEEKPNHPLISMESLQAGTGYSIKKYPQDIIDEANKILAEYLQKEIEIVKEDLENDEEKLNIDFDTYFLCGSYLDYGLARMRREQKICQIELQKRWDSGDRDLFYKYFEEHNVKPENFKLTNLE